MIQIRDLIIEQGTRLGLLRKPDFVVADIPDTPDETDLRPGVLFREVRDGFAKWAHFTCPRCHEQIQLPLGGPEGWSLRLDWLRRPTLRPSVWQTGSCGAHFFVTKGELVWVPDYRESGPRGAVRYRV